MAMQKYAIDAAQELLIWKDRFEGLQCTRLFYDVLYRGGPKSFETVRESAVRCTGVIEVKAVKGRSWEWGEHKELVWRKLMHSREVQTIYIQSHCPVCGEGSRSKVFAQDFHKAKPPVYDADKIPF